MDATSAAWKRRLAYYVGGFLVGFLPFAAVSALFFGFLIRRVPGLGYLPWVAAAAVIALRLWRGRSVAVFSCLAGLATPSLLIMTWLVSGPDIDEWWHETSFDAVAWQSQRETGEGDWPPRLCMVDDLIASKRLDGLTRAEVVALLGEPLPRGSFPAGGTDTDMHYYLGPERGLFRIDSEWLFIDLDAAGVIASYRLFRD